MKIWALGTVCASRTVRAKIKSFVGMGDGILDDDLGFDFALALDGCFPSGVANGIVKGCFGPQGCGCTLDVGVDLGQAEDSEGLEVRRHAFAHGVAQE